MSSFQPERWKMMFPIDCASFYMEEEYEAEYIEVNYSLWDIEDKYDEECGF